MQMKTKRRKRKTKQEIVMDAIENAKIREFVSTSASCVDISEQHKERVRLKDSRIKEILKRVGNATGRLSWAGQAYESRC